MERDRSPHRGACPSRVLDTDRVRDVVRLSYCSWTYYTVLMPMPRCSVHRRGPTSGIQNPKLSVHHSPIHNLNVQVRYSMECSSRRILPPRLEPHLDPLLLHYLSFNTILVYVTVHGYQILNTPYSGVRTRTDHPTGTLLHPNTALFY